ncbi:MAG TPA: exodeoxyribonuclease V subunit gamma [Balneolaceae bacterium]|nr:exodeoxyribonuclease V subunit gamma [Balneolaceae bacterium]
MLSLWQGNDLEILADHLIDERSQNKPSSPLAPEIFVVQNYGMSRWLSLYMAQKRGVSANLQFEFPAERMWHLFRLIDDEIPQTLPSDRLPMAFSIMQLLNQVENESVFEPLQAYIKDDSAQMSQLRGWKLSNKIADVFDQYLVYRPQMLLQWQAGKLTTKHASERWQAALWRTLDKSWKAKGGNGQIHRAELQQKLLQLIDEGRLDSSKLPQRITVFGVSALPPAFIQTFVKLSKLIDVHFYRSAPDVSVTENVLVNSMGAEGREFLQLFEQAVERDDDVQKHFHKTILEDKKQQPKTLLQKLQADITGRSNPAVTKVDNSIRVHSCHSAIREVEVLRDQLLALFDEDSSLSPDDIIIMTPDIETYAPLVDAVFGTKEEGLPNIPFNIDDGFRKESSLADTFIKTLDLLQSRFKVTDVMELLEAEPLRDALDISEDDLALIQQWVDDTNVRWGIDGHFKQEKGLPKNDHFTWKKGLSRIILGYAMQGEDDQIYDGKIPYSHIDGASDAELAGKLSRLLHRLFEFYEKVKQPKTLPGWRRFCLNVIINLFPENSQNNRELSQIRNQIDKLREYASVSNIEMPISFGVIRSFITDTFEKQQSGGFRGQGVTFCPTAPLRNISFKVIGMLGMNEGAFPSMKSQPEFDLIHSNPKPGDRSPASDERYLFLETLLSAKQTLLISYVGQSNMQDSHFPPSVVVSELLHFMEDEYEIEAGQLITKHRLQAFSPRYFNGQNPKLFSYAASQLEISRQLETGKEEMKSFIDQPLPEPEDSKIITVRDLISFFQHPMRYFLQQRLGIYLRETEILTEDCEPFSVGGLEGYQIRQELLNRFLKDMDLESFRDVAYAADALPSGFVGKHSFKEQLDASGLFGIELRNILDKPPNAGIDIDLNVNTFHIKGTLNSLFESGQWLYRFGKLRGKDCIELWIKHVIYLASKPEGYPAITQMITYDDGSVNQKTMADIENPEVILSGILELYKKGICSPLMFFPNTSFAFAEKVLEKGYEVEKAANGSKYEWENYKSDFKEGDDAYNNFIMGDKDPTQDSQFRKHALDFWQPFFTSTQKVAK